MTAGAALQAAPPVSFNRDIRPILSNNCFACHARTPPSARRVPLTRRAFAEDGIIVPGRAGSMLVKRITNPDRRNMPPPDSGHALTARQIELLRRWIDEGAKWDTHWAVQRRSARSPGGRKGRLGGTRRSLISRARTRRAQAVARGRQGDAAAPGDLRPDGLTADARRLVRFSPIARARRAQRRADALLQSPHYGERMAMPWFDASRYADTHGTTSTASARDSHGATGSSAPSIGISRMISSSSSSRGTCRRMRRASRSGLGFNRNHMITSGAIADEYQVEYVIDRVEATSTAFMGLTMKCARCHSHKFDPISHKEFYEFFASSTTPELGLDGRRGNAVPMIPLTSPAQRDARRPRRRDQGPRDRARR
jgi:hypothetical protein